jgi:hypothetical protein
MGKIKHFLKVMKRKPYARILNNKNYGFGHIFQVGQLKSLNSTEA